MRFLQWLAPIFQLTVGLAAVISYIVLSGTGEPMGKWTVTLFLAIAFIALGLWELISLLRRKK